MKIRIKGNYVRYRLTRSDVDKAIKTGILEEAVDFPGNKLIYALQLTNSDLFTASYTNNIITLGMPRRMMEELQHTDRIGFEGEQGDLHLLIEKDFVCLDNDIEDQSDNYPHPLTEDHHGKKC